jgi:hypothetical protein
VNLDPGHLLVSMVVSCVGLGAFLYGKKRPDPKALLIGIAMMGSTYFVSSTILLLGVGGVLTAGLFSESIQAKLAAKQKPKQIQSI